ncbi:MAG: restriction endonuclease [Verrucomicrobiia bacterium]
MPTKLTVEILQQEAISFAQVESKWPEPSLFGVTDGKAVGTYLEQKFQAYLQTRYEYDQGSAAKGIDFPGLDVDIKTTSIRQPQSSCPFKNARQKIYGLGYSLLIFVYEKRDDPANKTGLLDIQHTIFVQKEKTADHSMTVALRRMIEDGANSDDILAYFEERNLPVDEFECEKLAEEIISNPPQVGYLTISNARQWRLQYKRVIKQAGNVEGILRLV